MKAYSVISVIGPDRPGIVDEVSRIVARREGNIEDSRMAHLGGEFALMMLISGKAESQDEVADEIRSWAEANEMTAVVKPTTGPADTAGATAEIELDMPDQPGIVSRVTHFLAERGANVEGLETFVRPAPFTGTPTFSMHVNVRSAERIPLEQLRDALQDLAHDEDIRITIGTSA
jgi:glycine cleavage system transcriptional repressor